MASSHQAGLWRTILRAQESGLVLVILLMMAALTIYGAVKPKNKIEVVQAGAGVITQTDQAITITAGDQVQTLAKDQGWEVRGQTVRRTREVNRFLDLENLVLLAKDASFIAVMAVAMTAIIVLGGIDLSVGSIYALSALVGAMALRSLQAGWLGVDASGPIATAGGAPWYVSVPVGIGVCCLVGTLCGFANGAMTVGLRVHPFIVTLGSMAILRGITFVTTKGQSVFSFPESFTTGFYKAPLRIGHTQVFPVPVIIMVVVAIAGWFMLTRTVLGRRIYAIGGNETAAKYAGIPVGRVKIIAFCLMGLLAGLSASMYLGYLGAAASDAGQGYELSVIAAAVIGGASLSGGRGSALGAVLGALLIQLISNAMIILDIDTNYTQVVMGAAIILAVVLDQLKSRFLPQTA